MVNKILIVDDDKDLCESIRLAMESEGYEVRAAANGEEALKIMTGFIPNLVLLDLMMPGMNGLKLAQTLRENPLFTKLPIMMLTCVDNKDVKLKGYDVGINEFMIKPFGVWELLARARILLDPRGANDLKE